MSTRPTDPPGPSTPDPEPVAEGADASLVHLLTRLEVIHQRMRRLVEHRRPVAFSVDDPLRGMTLRVEDVEALLCERRDDRRLDVDADEDDAVTRIERIVDELERLGTPTRLRLVQRRFGLDRMDVDLLLVAALPDLDGRAEPILGFLNDDVGRKRATVGTALAVVGGAPLDPGARFRLSATGPLVAGRLIHLDHGAGFLGRPLRVPDRVTGFLLGDDAPDSRLRPFVRSVMPIVGAAPSTPSDEPGSVTALLAGGARRVHVRERRRGSARAAVAAAARGVERPLIDLDLGSIPLGDLTAVAGAAVLEAQLVDAVLLVGPIDRWRGIDGGSLPRLDLLFEGPSVVVMYGRDHWDPALAVWDVVPCDVAPPVVGPWVEAVGADDVDLTALAPFSLSPDDARRAVAVGRSLAAAASRRLTTDDVLAGARVQSSAALEQRSRRVTPTIRLTDMVVRAEVRDQLDQVVDRVRRRSTVLGEWQMRPGGGRGHGVSALFAGDPGTGKTMAAEAIAGELGFDLYVVDLSSVVDKYIGETEKHLERIFDEAEDVSGVLLFDEADALFGKRSEVSDARDRHSNVEVAYLLQRMERFDGVAILTTNLRANLDEAFSRRLDLIVDFPVPTAAERIRLWDGSLGTRIPRHHDLDLEFCGSSFDLSGGAIRAAAVSAAYRAAARDGIVAMRDVMEAIWTEYRKLGRLAAASEFGVWRDVLVGADR